MIAPLIALILQATAALDTPLPDATQEARAQALMAKNPNRA